MNCMVDINIARQCNKYCDKKYINIAYYNISARLSN